MTLIRSEGETVVLDALVIAQFSVNEQFGTNVKELVALALNEVLTKNPKLDVLQGAVGPFLSTDKAVAKFSNRILIASPLMNLISTQVRCIVD